MNGPWTVPDDSYKTTDDRDADVVAVESKWDMAGSMGSLRAALGQVPDPDDDGHIWRSVFGNGHG